MKLVFGIALVALVVSFFLCSLPRQGKLARFIGTPWETPLLLAATCSLAIGIVLVVAGWSQWEKVLQ